MLFVHIRRWCLTGRKFGTERRRECAPEKYVYLENSIFRESKKRVVRKKIRIIHTHIKCTGL